MSQTLLAVGALAVTMLLALATQEGVVHMERTTLNSEIETLAGQVAVNVLAHVGAQPFDSTTADGTASTVADLTPAAAFPTGLAYADADDVDDFHQMAPHTYVTADSVAFTVGAAVQYVDESFDPSATPTAQKEVTITVQHERLPSPVTLRRVVSW